ncbi:cytochrome c [Pseudomonas sp. SA3-5]|uniref:Cytochrome c n=1 Tax=Pseudomonas aestuarii TaxID=3018340 RepID=A0ABT4XJ00_9PSED|nr:cytochrome c [Pseudomonas aestuarii]MDA7088170.1 cytochrome c [Pseudomonas aestuarii]
MKALLFSSFAVMFLSAATQAAMPDGEALYRDNCASCHGDKGQGGVGMRLVGDSSTWPEELFQRAVFEGLDDEGKPLESTMPHWQDRSFSADEGAPPSAAEVTAIYHYLRSLE